MRGQDGDSTGMARSRHVLVSLYFSPYLWFSISIPYQLTLVYFIINTMTSKELTYHNIIQNQLAGLYDHMTNNLLAWLPENGYINEDDFTDKQREQVAAVLAIEEEWVLDPAIRAEVTLISWEES